MTPPSSVGMNPARTTASPTSSSPPFERSLEAMQPDQKKEERDSRVVSGKMTKQGECGEPVPDPSVIVIFGASGDLTQRKLIPALFHLAQEGHLPEAWDVLGPGRSAMDDEGFRKLVAASIESGARTPVSNLSSREAFIGRFHYLAGDSHEPE